MHLNQDRQQFYHQVTNILLNRVLVLLCLCIYSTTNYAGVNNHRFKHLNSDDGLSSSQISSILRSSNGYYWIGTFNGLNRYNGYDFKVYKTDENNPYSLSNNQISELLEDVDGNLWVATEEGLNKLNVKTGQFTRFQSNDDNNSLSHNWVRSLLLDDSKIWLGTTNGLDVLDIETSFIENKLKGRPILDVVDDGNFLWLASDNHLLSYNKITMVISSYRAPYSKVKIRKIVKYQDDLWLATTNGLLSFDLLKHEYKSDDFQLIGEYIYSLVVQEHGVLWIGTANKGLFDYSVSSRELRKVDTNVLDDFHLQSQLILSLAVYDDQLWVGSNEGVSYTFLDKNVQFLRASNNEIVANSVWALKQDSSDDLWVGTDQGVSHLSKKYVNHFELGRITRILEIDESIWAVGYQGVFQNIKDKKKFENHRSNISELNKLNAERVSNIIHIDSNKFLLATDYGPVYWDQKTKESYSLEFVDKNKLKSARAILYFFRYKNNLLLGARDGLYVFNSGSNLISQYLHEEETSQFDITYVYQLASDQNDYLWVASEKGLLKVKDRQIVANYTVEDGLPDNFIRSIIIVDQVIWVATDNGLAAFEIGNHRFNRIHLNNDQFDIEFNSGGAIQSRDGLLYFVSIEGVLYFDPKDFLKSASSPITTITDFHLFNRPIQPGSGFLPQAIEYTDHIELTYDQNMLTFEFSSMNINQPNHLYAYQLEGLNDSNDWIITGASNRRATFTPGPGSYTFRVKSGWDKDTWSDDIAELNVVVLPPWWKTNWAYTIYIALFLMSMFGYIRIRTLSLSKTAKKLEMIVNERTEALKSSNEELQESHKKVEFLLERKNILFANTSHELRTPLTLILGPINKLLKICSNELKQDLLLAKRNTERLVHMVDQLLELARISSPTQDEFINTNFSEVLSLVIHSLTSLLQERSIKLQHDIESDIFISAIPDALDIIVLNLLSNAVKYTEYGGNINVSLLKQDGDAVLCVKDTGIGIAKSEQGKIFEKFTRLEDARYRDIPGSGIGLALVKELVDLHQGKINLLSDVGQGSEFTIALPLSVSQASEMVNVETTQSDEKKVATIKSYLSMDKVQDEKTSYSTSDEIKLTVPKEKPSLLIVDDVPDMLNYLQQITSPYYACTVVDNGKAALKHAEEHSPELILCDVMMPGMDGFEVLQTLRDNIQTSHIPIILLTAKGDKLSRLKGYNAQVDDYIAKPFDADELLARIDSLIRNRQNLRDYFSQVLDSGKLSLDTKDKRLVKKDQEFLSKFQSLVEAHFQQQGYTVVDMARAVFMSERSLQKKLKAITGHSPIAYLNQYRLQQASIYLKESDLPIQSIIENVGFSDASNFTRMFKKYYGKSPREYRS